MNVFNANSLLRQKAEKPETQKAKQRDSQGVGHGKSWLSLVGCLAVWLSGFPAVGDAAPPPDDHPIAAAATRPQISSVQDEVLANIRNQVVGNHTVADFDLPEGFLRGLADRIICSSYEERFRMIVRDRLAPAEQQSQPPNHPPAVAASQPGGAGEADDGRIVMHVVERADSDAVRRYRAGLLEARPPLFGFRAPILNNAAQAWPFDPPGSEAPVVLHQAADLVGKRLARDGLLITVAQVVLLIGPARFSGNSEVETNVLRAVGLPVDLLEYFKAPESATSASIVGFIASELARGQTADVLSPRLAAARFEFHPSCPGFRVATESGESRIDAIRLQLTRGSYWEGIGDGGNLDMARQLIQALPDVAFIASIQRQHVEQFTALARTWRPPVPDTRKLTVLSEELTVAQWAQDNAKTGLVEPPQQPPPTNRETPATDHPQAQSGGGAVLVPRYASRGEDGSTFVPGETFLLEGLAALGQRVIQSPLLFQGGNLMPVRDPATGQRILLIGEAEVHRNLVLGLTRSQILDVFRIEFGVDRCEILPAVSFHIDYDLCVRAHEGRLLAFVNDVPAAAAIVLQRAVGVGGVLESHQIIDAATAAAASEHLQAGRRREFLALIEDRMLSLSDGDGHFPLSLARHFSVDPVDSGVGNFQRALLALDLLASQAMQGSPDDPPRDRNRREYLQALARCETARQVLHQRLRDLGFELVAVPGLTDAARGIGFVNGIHARDYYIMPAYGGLFSGLDEAAAAVLANALGPKVQVVPVQCSESQRRVGAIHCSCSVYFRP